MPVSNRSVHQNFSGALLSEVRRFLYCLSARAIIRISEKENYRNNHGGYHAKNTGCTGMWLNNFGLKAREEIPCYSVAIRQS